MKKLEMPKGWDKKDQACQIAWSNFEAAVDQQGEYPSLEKAFSAYYQNTMDTAVENGLGEKGWDEAGTVFWALVSYNFPGMC